MRNAALIFAQSQVMRRPRARESTTQAEPPIPPREAAVLAIIAREAETAGATLRSGGRGGLPPSLVLGIFRRDHWRCRRCGGKEDLTIHHVGGIILTKWLVKKGARNDPANLLTLDHKCHDKVHDEGRAALANLP